MPVDKRPVDPWAGSSGSSGPRGIDPWAAGIPPPTPTGIGAARVIPPGSESTVYDPSKAASVPNIAIGSFLDAPEDKIAWFARQRGLDPSVYRVEPDGGVSYLDPETGGRFLEVPPENSGAPIRRLANEASTALPIAGGILGAAAGAGAGGIGGYALRSAGAGAGSALGEYVREWTRGQLGGPPPSAAGVAVQGAAGLIGQGVGEPIGILAGKMARPLADAAVDVSSGASVRAPRLPGGAPDDVGLLDTAAATRALGQAESLTPPVQLTTGEASGLPSQIARQRVLQSSEGGFAPMQQRLTQRTAAFEGNLERFLETGPAPSPKASEMYRKAFDAAEPTDLDPVFTAIEREMRRSAGDERAALKAVTEDLTHAIGGSSGRVTWNLEMLDAIKKRIDAKAYDPPAGMLAASGISSARKSTIVGLRNVRDALVKAADDANPLYASARRQHRIEAAPTRVAEMLDRNDITPKEVLGAKVKYLADPELSGAWDRGVKQYMMTEWRNSLESASAKVGTYKPAVRINRPAEFAAGFKSNPDRWAAVKAAMNPRDLRHFETLMDVAERTGTAGPFGAASGVAAAEKADVTKSHAAGAVRLAMPLGRLLEARQQVVNFLAPGSEARAAEALFNPDMRRLAAQYRAAVAGRNAEAATRAATTLMLRAGANLQAANLVPPAPAGATAGSKLGETATPP